MRWGVGGYFLLRGGRRTCGDWELGGELGLGLRLGLGSCLPQGAMWGGGVTSTVSRWSSRSLVARCLRPMRESVWRRALRISGLYQKKKLRWVSLSSGERATSTLEPS